MLLGEYEARIDTKNRVAMPSKFRKELGESVIITKGYEETLILVSQESWKTLLEGTEGKPLIQTEIREVQRFLLGGASDIILDNKGRARIPRYLQTFARLEQDIIFLGLSRYIEIWAKDRWEAHKKVLEENIGRISQRLVPWEIVRSEKAKS